MLKQIHGETEKLRHAVMDKGGNLENQKWKFGQKQRTEENKRQIMRERRERDEMVRERQKMRECEREEDIVEEKERDIQ